MLRINLLPTRAQRGPAGLIMRNLIGKFRDWLGVKVSPIKSLFVGLAANLFLQVVAVPLVSYFFFFPGNWGITFSLRLFFFATFGVLGIVNVKIAHVGVPTFFGKRMEGVELQEGWHWLLPRLFMAAEEVSLELRTINIPKLTIVAGGKQEDEEEGAETENGEEGTGVAVEFEIDAAIQYQADNAYKILSIGEEVISLGLVTLVSDILREEASKRGPIVLLRSREGLRDAVKKGVDEKSEDWGIDAQKILIGELLIKSQETRDSFERITKERRQRESEQMNIEARIAQAKTVRANLSEIGQEFAINFVAAEAGTLTRVEVSGNAPDLVKAAASVGIDKKDKKKG
jgi:hypothetical protein